HLMTISGRAEGEDPVPGSNDPRYGLDHFGFEVDDMEEAAAHLRAHGAHFICEPWTMPSGSTVAFIEAPDHVSVEIIQRPKG
ncbi:MAG: VOC family protein, partial [Chloroflexi bacterium]|nr:VOC family protein [Chloroflexota bacterium]